MQTKTIEYGYKFTDKKYTSTIDVPVYDSVDEALANEPAEDLLRSINAGIRFRRVNRARQELQKKNGHTPHREDIARAIARALRNRDAEALRKYGLMLQS